MLGIVSTSPSTQDSSLSAAHALMQTYKMPPALELRLANVEPFCTWLRAQSVHRRYQVEVGC